MVAGPSPRIKLQPTPPGPPPPATCVFLLERLESETGWHRYLGQSPQCLSLLMVGTEPLLLSHAFSLRHLTEDNHFRPARNVEEGCHEGTSAVCDGRIPDGKAEGTVAPSRSARSLCRLGKGNKLHVSARSEGQTARIERPLPRLRQSVSNGSRHYVLEWPTRFRGRPSLTRAAVPGRSTLRRAQAWAPRRA